MSVLKLKLDNDDITSAFYDEIRILGIVSPMQDYMFSWAVNNHLGMNFRINTSMEIQLRKKNRNYFFSIYHYQPANRVLNHFIYSNQYEGEYLLPELKHLDYLWLLKNDTVNDTELSELMQAIKKIPGVQLVTEMQPDKIKNKQHLLF
ncbi:MAG: IPExxxVDY family protein [Chitinophagaceae bacterium]|nr:MAG: IPExxxVDY family protein [Chitinophagaceae bacterium]